MWFLLGAKFYGNLIFYIRGQHDVFKGQGHLGKLLRETR